MHRFVFSLTNGGLVKIICLEHQDANEDALPKDCALEAFIFLNKAFGQAFPESKELARFMESNKEASP